MKSIELDAGQLEFRLTVDGTATTWSVDLIEVKLVCQNVEDRHKLRQENGVLQGTVAFFRDLAAAFSAELGCPSENSTVASHVWGIVNERFIQVSDSLSTQLSNLD